MHSLTRHAGVVVLSLFGLLALVAALAAPRPAQAATAVSFAAPRQVRIKPSPQALAAGRFNGGRKDDLAVVNGTALHASSTTVSIVRAGSGGGFHVLRSLRVAPYACAIAVADLNRDGKADLLIAADKGYGHVATLSVRLGNGNATFRAPHTYRLGVIPRGYRPYPILVGDLNGDHRPDVVVGMGDKVGVLLGTGGGRLGALHTYVADPAGLADGALFALALGDVNGDGRLDAVAGCIEGVNSPQGVVSVLRGRGNGAFRAARTRSTGFLLPTGVALADVNRDGKADLLVNYDDDVSDQGIAPGVDFAAIGVSLGNGDATFSQTAEYDLAELGNGALALADFNRDGQPDLAVVLNSGFDVLLGVGDGTFQAPVAFPHSHWSGDASAAVGDFNGDRRPDVAVADGKTLSVFVNRP